jgi:hypothetical protein
VFERPASNEKFYAEFPLIWLGDANTVNQGHVFGLRSPVDGAFRGETGSPNRCSYVNAIKSIPKSTNNLYRLSFDAIHVGANNTCDHVGTNYQGYAATIDGGTLARDVDGLMWFAATNGEFSVFTILELND